MFKSSVATASLSLIFGCALVVLVGCENSEQRADREAEKKVAAAEKARGNATDLSMLNSAQAQYDSAVQEVGLSPSMKIVIRGRQAQLRFERAMQIVGQLQGKEWAINRAINDLADLALQVAAAQSNIVALQAGDPSSQMDALKARQADLRDQLSKLGDTIQGLNEGITSDQAAADQLHKVSGDAQDQAETLERTSEGEKGDDQMRDVIQVSKLRSDAGIADAKADTLASQIGLFKADLKTAELRKASLQSTVDALDAQTQTLQAEWTVVQQQIDSQRNLEKQLIGDDASAAAAPSDDKAARVTIAQRLTELVALQQDAGGLRDTATTELNAAADQFADAASVAERLRGDLLRRLQESPNNASAPIWHQTMETLHPMTYNMQKATAMQAMVSVVAAKAGIDSLTSRLLDGYEADSAPADAQGKTAATAPATQPAMRIVGLLDLLSPQRTGVPSPKALADVIRPDPAQIKQAVDDVDARYKDILDAYLKRYGTDSGPMATARSNIALMSRAVANRQWAQFAMMMGDADGSAQHQHDADSDESQVDPAFRVLATSSTPPAAPADAATTTPPAAAPAAQ